MEKYPMIKTKDGKKYFYRFTLDQRIQHVILAATVVILVLTGMPLKFSSASWAPYLYAIFGGIEVAPIVHKTAGAIILLLFVYHVVYLAVNIYKLQIVPLKKKEGLSTINVLKLLANQPLVPNLKDANDIGNL